MFGTLGGCLWEPSQDCFILLDRSAEVLDVAAGSAFVFLDKERGEGLAEVNLLLCGQIALG